MGWNNLAMLIWFLILSGRVCQIGEYDWKEDGILERIRRASNEVLHTLRLLFFVHDFGVFCVFRLLFSHCRNGLASMTCVGTLVVKL